jgi:hypothetical protein
MTIIIKGWKLPVVMGLITAAALYVFYISKPRIIREWPVGREIHFIDSKDRYGKIFEINPLAVDEQNRKRRPSK